MSRKRSRNKEHLTEIQESQSSETKALVQAAAERLALASTEVKIAPVFEVTKPRTVVVASNGIFELRDTLVGVVTHCVSKEGIKGLPEQSTSFGLAVPKIPWSSFCEVVAFFRAVWKKHHTEALVRGYYHIKNGWTFMVPEQTVTSGSVNVEDNVIDPGLGALLCEIHSHPGSGSSFSSTDDKDELAQRIYGCVADHEKFPNWHWRIGTGVNQWMNVVLEDVVELPTEPITVTVGIDSVLRGALINPFHRVEVPDGWLGNVKLPTKPPLITTLTGTYFTPSWARDKQTQHNSEHRNPRIRALTEEGEQDLYDMMYKHRDTRFDFGS